MSDLEIFNGMIIPSFVTKNGNLGKYIIKIRVDLSMTQAAMAKKLGISGAMLSSIEKRKKHISSNVVERFIAEFGLNESEQREFIKLSIMNNIAIEAEKIIKEITRKNG